MKKQFAMFVLLLFVLSGCASPLLPPDSPTSPANSQVEESKPARPASPLIADEITAAVVARLSEARGPAERPGASQDMSGMEGMQGMDHSQMQGMNHSGSPKAEAKESQSKEALEAEMKKTADEMKEVSDQLKQRSDAAKAGKKPSAVVYTCAMHPQVEQPNPGKCPICGMTLVKKQSK